RRAPFPGDVEHVDAPHRQAPVVADDGRHRQQVARKGRHPVKLPVAMADPLLTLRPRLSAAIEAAFGAEYAGTDPVLRRSDKGGDYQANAAMALAKRVGRPPREVAEAIVAAADLTDVVD